MVHLDALLPTPPLGWCCRCWCFSSLLRKRLNGRPIHPGVVRVSEGWSLPSLGFVVFASLRSPTLLGFRVCKCYRAVGGWWRISHGVFLVAVDDVDVATRRCRHICAVVGTCRVIRIGVDVEESVGQRKEEGRYAQIGPPISWVPLRSSSLHQLFCPINPAHIP